jgi:magnesium transporter
MRFDHDTAMLDTHTNAEADRSEAHASVHDALVRITGLLRKHRLVEGLVREQIGDTGVPAAPELTESAVYKKSKAELTGELDRLHPADIAYILEALPPDERLYIWEPRSRVARRRNPARGVGRRP